MRKVLLLHIKQGDFWVAEAVICQARGIAANEDLSRHRPLFWGSPEKAYFKTHWSYRISRLLVTEGVHLVTGLLSTNALLIIVMLVFIVSGWSQVLLNSCLVFAVHIQEIRICNYSFSVPKITSLLLSAVGMWSLQGLKEGNRFVLYASEVQPGSKPGRQDRKLHIPKYTTLLHHSAMWHSVAVPSTGFGHRAVQQWW